MLLPSEEVFGRGGVYTGSDDEISKYLERFASLVAAAEADKFKWDVHSCGPTCERYACVATRNAVAAEREACASLVEQMGYSGYGTLGIAVSIRARGEK